MGLPLEITEYEFKDGTIYNRGSGDFSLTAGTGLTAVMGSETMVTVSDNE